MRLELASSPSTSERQRMAQQGTALPDGSFPIPDRAHLYAAMQAFGRCPEPSRAALVSLIRKRARVLGAIADPRVVQFLADHTGGSTKGP